MSMYAVNQHAVNQHAVNEHAIDRYTDPGNDTGVEWVTSNPVTAPPRPYLRLVTPPVVSAGRASRAVYWRRRLVVVLVVMALLGTARALVGGAQAAPDAAQGRSVASAAMSETAAPRTYVVQQGDTLWSIARRLQPDGDVRPVVDRLAARHRGAPLRVGERIALP